MHVRWEKGGEARVVALDGDRVELLSTVASAPGSRPAGSLASGMAMRVKVARCRRREDAPGDGSPLYTIEGRLIDATRDARAEIAALVSPLPGGAPLGAALGAPLGAPPKTDDGEPPREP